MFFKKKKAVNTYDPAVKEPVIRASICTGEKTAGFRYIQGGKFEEVMLIRNAADLEEFRSKYGITGEIKTIY